MKSALSFQVLNSILFLYMSEKPGHQIMLSVGMSFIEAVCPSIEKSQHSQLKNCLDCFLRGIWTFEACSETFTKVLGRNDPIVHIKNLVNLNNEPIPPKNDHDDCSEEIYPRRKTRTWSSYEDERLIAGLYRYGLENWSQVSSFVGNSRTRAQCSQRWYRGLDPKICKKNWTEDEDHQLMELVHLYGDKAWTKIASILGNRSDVQCRYHYKQISKDIVPNSNSRNVPNISKNEPHIQFGYYYNCLSLVKNPIQSIFTHRPSFERSNSISYIDERTITPNIDHFLVHFQ